MIVPVKQYRGADRGKCHDAFIDLAEIDLFFIERVQIDGNPVYPVMMTVANVITKSGNGAVLLYDDAFQAAWAKRISAANPDKMDRVIALLESIEASTPITG